MSARIAVVGHVEWVTFLRVARLPERGEIVPAERVRTGAAGGAVVAAAILAETGAEVAFFGAVGDDELGRRAAAELRSRGIAAHLALRATHPTREAITLLDRGGERTIITVGERLEPRGGDPLPWGELAETDGVYVTAGDLAALRHARAARVLVTTPRAGRADVALDALILSAGDGEEERLAGPLRARARWVVETDGARGGRWHGVSDGGWTPEPLPGPVADTYGAGDSFAAGFTLGLAQTGDPAEAARQGAQLSARMLTRAGAP